MEFFKNISDRLFKREAPEEDFESIFQRVELSHFFTFLNNVYDPSDILSKLGGRLALEKLMMDPEIFSAWDKRQSAILDTKLSFHGESEKVIEFIEKQILPHERQLKEDFSLAVPFGYSVEQIVYNEDRSGNVVGFQREEFYRFAPLPDLMHVMVIQSDTPELNNKIMPYGKWVLTTNKGSYNNPQGVAILEKLIQFWLFRCTDWELWMSFAKKFANGFLYGQTPNADDITDFRKALEKAQKSAVIATTKESNVTLVQPNRDPSLYKSIDEHCIATFQKVILGEVLSSQPGESGSFALGRVQNDVRIEKFLNDKNLMEKSFNEVIRQICYVNGIEEKDIPKSSLSVETGLNEELARRDAILSSTGQVQFKKKYFIDKYGFEEDEIEIREPQETQSFFKPKNKSLFLKPSDIEEYLGIDEICKDCNGEPTVLNLRPDIKRKENRQDEEKEDTIAYLKRNGREPIDIDDMISAIRNAKNERDLDDSLLALFDQDSPEFVDTLTESMYYTASKGALYGNPKKLKLEEED